MPHRQRPDWLVAERCDCRIFRAPPSRARTRPLRNQSPSSQHCPRHRTNPAAQRRQRVRFLEFEPTFFSPYTHLLGFLAVNLRQDTQRPGQPSPPPGLIGFAAVELSDVRLNPLLGAALKLAPINAACV